MSSLAGIALSLLASWVGFTLHFNLAAIGFVQLYVVLLIALRAGFLPASLASLAANACLIYFFVPPIFTFAIADPRNWVALIVFELSALLVSRLSAQSQEQMQKVRSHQAELECLYHLAQQLLHLTRDQAAAPEILAAVQTVFKVDAAVFFDAAEAAAVTIGDADAAFADWTRVSYLQDHDFKPDDGQTWTRVLRIGGQPVGALGLRSPNLSGVAVDAITSLVAISLERTRSLESENRAKAERQAERLRTAVLDALAHEYKTPLTVIRTVASGLLEMGELTPLQSELLSIVDSSVTRLSRLTTRLLQTSRLDEADIHIRNERFYLEELVESVLSNMHGAIGGHTVDVHACEANLSVIGDRELISMAVVQFLDNAVKYSDPASTITISIEAREQEIQLSVHNKGPLINAEDQIKVFQRFYRCDNANQTPTGTGIGLSITKRVADVHRGRVWVKSEEGRGNTFVLALPMSA